MSSSWFLLILGRTIAPNSILTPLIQNVSYAPAQIDLLNDWIRYDLGMLSLIWDVGNGILLISFNYYWHKHSILVPKTVTALR